MTAYTRSPILQHPYAYGAAVGGEPLDCNTVAAKAETYVVGSVETASTAGGVASPTARTPSQTIKFDALNTRVRLKTMATTANSSADNLTTSTRVHTALARLIHT